MNHPWLIDSLGNFDKNVKINKKERVEAIENISHFKEVSQF